MSKIIQAFKENAREEHWLSVKSEKAVREKVYIIFAQHTFSIVFVAQDFPNL